ncbi:hypothetical protein GGR13_002171 [Brevundimonas variabilis]|uniref:Uncharacterized protein n=2 Tax=Brevundimonas variabilis TaxID=74312 RepID=A0A7W9CJX2_9CAUL|nr:hypothetical protein [Brevundimonas variabilis]
MREQGVRRVPREDIVPAVGVRLIVCCDSPVCNHAVLMDPRPVFGASRYWPAVGQSYRFRCQCGHRVAQVSYTDNADQAEGPISAAALKLWF